MVNRAFFPAFDAENAHLGKKQALTHSKKFNPVIIAIAYYQETGERISSLILHQPDTKVVQLISITKTLKKERAYFVYAFFNEEEQ